MSYNIQDPGGARKTIDWDSFYDAANDPVIGYDPASDKIIILKGADSSSGMDNGFIYDMVTGSWTSTTLSPSEVDKSNFAVFGSSNLLIKNHDASTTTFEKFSAAPVAANNFQWQSKSFDFGHPGAKKKLYKVIVHGSNLDDMEVKISYNGAAASDVFAANLTGTTSDLHKQELTVSTPTAFSYCAVNIQIGSGDTCQSDISINDISLIYRVLSIH
jgi:hypothetical protein